MSVEMAPDHRDVRIIFGHPAMFPKSVRRAVDAHETLATLDRFVQRFLALFRNRRLLVSSFLGQVASRVEHKRVPLTNFIRIKHMSIFGTDDFESVRLADLGQDSFGMTQLVTLPGYGRM